MTFENYSTDSFGNILAILLLGFMGCLFLGTIWGLSERDRKLGQYVALACALTFLGVAIVTGNLSHANKEREHHNQQIAEDNLKQKYDIVGVIWETHSDGRTTTAKPQIYDGLESLTVQDKNGNVLRLNYRVDSRTQEPYLLNDGQSPQIKVNDLLRNQSGK